MTGYLGRFNLFGGEQDHVRYDGRDAVRQEHVEDQLETVEDRFVRFGDGNVSQIGRESHRQSRHHRRHNLIGVEATPIGALKPSAR